MKLSLSWLFDHIQEKTTLSDELVAKITERLGARTTELDQVKKIVYPLEQLTLAQLKTKSDTSHTLNSPELRKEITVDARKDGTVGSWYLLIKDSKQYRYATNQDLHGEKEGLIPELWVTETEPSLREELRRAGKLGEAGEWKKSINPVDYIITLDNKAITHRPDLWGHRGFAREVAALFNYTLRAEDAIAALLPIRHHVDNAPASKEFPFELAIDTIACRRLAAMTIAQATLKPSVPWMAFRLIAVDSRPLHAVVDATNYVMFDSGQPMHVFDAASIKNKLEARNADAGEKLTLLDGETITLAAQDCIIADGRKPVALAGIMGGKESSTTLASTTLIAEAANFDADTIRLSSVQHKRRTESSVRFEKSLDPNQNTFALLRFKRLLDELGIAYTAPQAIVSLGSLAQERTIEVSHAYVQDRIGVTVSSDTVVTNLTKLGFGVVVQQKEKGAWYTVSVPTFRATKDVLHKEDIIEEVARIIGYDTISPHLPTRLMKPLDHRAMLKIRALKKQCAFGLQMHEVNNYALYDEEFLRTVQYDPRDTIILKNPVSENWRRMVTSLVPHLFKQVATNVPRYEQVNLFEINNVWQQMAQQEFVERKKLAMIFFAYKKEFDFYEGKARLQTIFDLLRMLVAWQKPYTEKELAPWYLAEQSAELVCGDTIIGHAGKASPRWLQSIGEGDAFIVELDAQFLVDFQPEPLRYHAVSKYQPVELDISMLVPLAVTVDAIKHAIAQADARIIAVQLTDFFEKPEWKDQRSVTVRFTISDTDKTLVKQEIDDVWDSVVKKVSAQGAQVR